MAKFDKGETVVCWRNVKNDAGEYVDPSTSFKISIECPNGNDVTGADMVQNDSETGKYHYDYQTVDCNKGEGKHIVTYVAIDGARITIFHSSFELALPEV